MPEKQPPEGDLSAEFRELGKNLSDALRTAWERPERKQLQQEIEQGLKEFGKTLRQEADSFSESPTGQRLKEDADDLRERVRSGQVEEKARSELLEALRTINVQLQKVISRWSVPQEGPAPSETTREE